MSRTVVYPVHVSFGDCDPAGIVFFPNFSRWMDAATHHFFRACGLPPWHALEEIPHCVGGPLLEIHTRFLKPATDGDRLEVHTSVAEWRRKVFVVDHRIRRGEDLLCEGRETRALCVKPPGEAMKSVVIPDWLRKRCD
ncbi:MAG TPA: thioesterase family protein [Methylibium sp.]|uniref:acyl-CoA thioesterase n=1 Tax=Methylibium sp. TaxID=2067992 RepID=UPI002DB5812A|nr:thioesterase family protein [Methylibium sp.]HEU4457813.1 thioesterase family protein [Methylibium sp.]